MQQVFHSLKLPTLLLRFTFEKESNSSFSFSYVLVKKSDSYFILSVYRKPTFTSDYVRLNSFCHKELKTNLIFALVHKALAIYSKSTLQNKLATIRSIFLNSGYPEHVVNMPSPRRSDINHCPVNLHLPWLRNVSTRFKTQIKTSVTNVAFLPSNLTLCTLPDFYQQPKIVSPIQ